MKKTSFTPQNEIEFYLNNSFNLEIYEELNQSEGWGEFFEPLDFFNLLYEQYEIVTANKSEPLSVTKHLLNLGLNKEQLYFLLSYLINLAYRDRHNLVDFLDKGPLYVCLHFIKKEHDRIRRELSPQLENEPELINDYDNDNSKETLKSTGAEQNIQEALITFSNPKIFDLTFNELKVYFSEREADLKKVLRGERIEQPLLFPHHQNKLVEVFRRLKYNGFLLNNSTEIRDWLCQNFKFRYKRGRQEDSRQLNQKTTWDVLSKGKGEPMKKERILNLDWLPYKSHASLKEEARKEQQ